MRSALARSRYYIIAKGNNADFSRTHYILDVLEAHCGRTKKSCIKAVGHDERLGETEEWICTLPLAESYTVRQNQVLPCGTRVHARLSPFAHSLQVLRERSKGTRVCEFLKVTPLPIISLQVRGHYRWAVNFHSPSQISLRNGVNCIFVLEKKNKWSLCQIFFGRSQAWGFCLSCLGGLWRDWRAP